MSSDSQAGSIPNLRSGVFFFFASLFLWLEREKK